MHRLWEQWRERQNDDAGFTLTELLVYMLLSAIVGTMVVMLMWNGYRTQMNVTETTSNTGATQNAISSLNNDVRYAAAISIVPGGDILLTRTWIGDPTTGGYQCRGWFYDDEDNVLRRTADSDDTSTASTTSARSWSVYVNGVTATTPFASPTEGVVHVRFTGDPERWGRATDIDTQIRQRPQPDQGSGSCF